MPDQKISEVSNLIGDENLITQQPSGIQSFIALWTRMRILITRTFRGLCGCASTLQSNGIRRTSFPIVELTDKASDEGIHKKESAFSLNYPSRCPSEDSGIARRELEIVKYPLVAEHCQQTAYESLSLMISWHGSSWQVRDNATFTHNATASERHIEETPVVHFSPFLFARPQPSRQICFLAAPGNLTVKKEVIHGRLTNFQTGCQSEKENTVSFKSALIPDIAELNYNNVVYFSSLNSKSLLPVDESNKSCEISNPLISQGLSTSMNFSNVHDFVESLISNAESHLNNLINEKNVSSVELIPSCPRDSEFVNKVTPSDDYGDSDVDDYEVSRLRTKLLTATSKKRRRSSPPPSPYEIQPSAVQEEQEAYEEAKYSSYDSTQQNHTIKPIFNPFLLDAKRHSSMKSEHSPLYVPVKKLVRFADCMGLDLESERRVFDQDKPPKIPDSAIQFLNIEFNDLCKTTEKRHFKLCFSQPGASSSFIRRVLETGVVLENAEVNAAIGQLTGTIRVKSFGFDKTAAARMTYNNWETYFDLPATRIPDSFDGATERFTFSITFPSTVNCNNNCIYFAIFYTVLSGETLWDNNYGENYCILCSQANNDASGASAGASLSH